MNTQSILLPTFALLSFLGANAMPFLEVEGKEVHFFSEPAMFLTLFLVSNMRLALSIVAGKLWDKSRSQSLWAGFFSVCVLLFYYWYGWLDGWIDQKHEYLFYAINTVVFFCEIVLAFLQTRNVTRDTLSSAETELYSMKDANAKLNRRIAQLEKDLSKLPEKEAGLKAADEELKALRSDYSVLRKKSIAQDEQIETLKSRHNLIDTPFQDSESKRWYFVSSETNICVSIKSPDMPWDGDLHSLIRANNSQGETVGNYLERVKANS